MKKLTLIFAITSCFFYACNNSPESSENSATTSTVPSTESTGPSASEMSAQMTTTADTIGMTTPVTTTVTPPQPVTTEQAVKTTAAGMNPPHGEPGHRCDIAIGAPLNSAPTAATTVNATNAQPVITTSAPPTPAPQPATKVVTAPGMNPPHGEPGHDCAIAVGAPLKK